MTFSHYQIPRTHRPQAWILKNKERSKSFLQQVIHSLCNIHLPSQLKQHSLSPSQQEQLLMAHKWLHKLKQNPSQISTTFFPQTRSRAAVIHLQMLWAPILPGSVKQPRSRKNQRNTRSVSFRRNLKINRLKHPMSHSRWPQLVLIVYLVESCHPNRQLCPRFSKQTQLSTSILLRVQLQFRLQARVRHSTSHFD